MRPVLDHPALPFGHGQGRHEIQRLSAPSQPCTAALIGNGSSCPPSYGMKVARAPLGDRTSVVQGTSVSVLFALGGSLILTHKSHYYFTPLHFFPSFFFLLSILFIN